MCNPDLAVDHQGPLSLCTKHPHCDRSPAEQHQEGGPVASFQFVLSFSVSFFKATGTLHIRGKICCISAKKKTNSVCFSGFRRGFDEGLKEYQD